jgi:hypothetical protein
MFKVLNDSQLLTVLDPELEEKLRGKNNRARAEYFMSREDFEGVDLKPEVVTKIYKYFETGFNRSKEKGEPVFYNINNYTDAQIEFIKNFLKKTPISEAGSINKLVELINQT